MEGKIFKLIPKKLKRGDKIGIVAPSKNLGEEHKDYLNKFKDYVEKDLGLKVVFGKYIFEKDKFGTAAGTPEQRAEDINNMFKNKEINAIWGYQGGGSANQVLNLLDFKAIKENPKLFMGMSDIDVLLLAINKMTGLITFNTPDSKRGRGLDLDFDYSRKSFVERIFEGSKEIKPNSKWKCIKEGKASGKIMGCNISCILKLAGTKYFPNFDGAILFLEGYTPDVEEMQWKLEQLKQNGVFDKIKGMVIGFIYSFQDEEQRKEKDINIDFEDMILEATKEYNFPILKINEFGHKCQNAFIPIGVNVDMDAKKKVLNIIEDFIK